MQILILGAGQVGSSLAESLCQEHDVTVVDQDSQHLSLLQNRLDIRTVEGQAATPHTLIEAGAREAGMLIAVTGSDESNMIACQLCYLLFKTPIKIARIRSRELYQYPELFNDDRIPIDLIIDPATLVMERLKQQIEHPGCLLLWQFMPEQCFSIAAIRIESGSWLTSLSWQSLSNQAKEAGFFFTPAALVRNHTLLLPESSQNFALYDELFFGVATETLNQFSAFLLGTPPYRYKKVMIAGAGHIGTALAANLENDYQVKIIETSAHKSQKAAESLHQALVLQGDATDTDLLQQENIDQIDLFCSVTNDDEANIMAAILAKRMGAKHTIALVNRQRYAHYLIERSPDIDMTLSPQYVTRGKILTQLYHHSLEMLYPFPYDHGYAIELILSQDNLKLKHLLGQTLKQVKLPKTCRIIALSRDNAILWPSPELPLQEQDHIVMVIKEVIPWL